MAAWVDGPRHLILCDLCVLCGPSTDPTHVSGSSRRARQPFCSAAEKGLMNGFRFFHVYQDAWKSRSNCRLRRLIRINGRNQSVQLLGIGKIGCVSMLDAIPLYGRLDRRSVRNPC